MAPIWTDEQNMKFESALAETIVMFAKVGMPNDSNFPPEFWNTIVEKAGEGKSVKDVKKQYKKLEENDEELLAEGKAPKLVTMWNNALKKEGDGKDLGK